jgi:hypothetical protein
MTSICRTNVDGDKFWRKNGRYHRTTGPAVEYADGSKFWYQNGKLHRTDGPAVKYVNGYAEWYQYSCLHRTDGPAIEHVDGDTEWWVNDTRMSVAEFAAIIPDKETALLWKMSGYCWPFDFS